MKPFVAVKLFFLLLLLLLHLSCSDTGIWQLVWSDEFNYEGEPDPGKWSIVEKPARWVNQEAQAYVDNRENLRVENGNLIIQAHRNHDGGYTSGRLDTFITGKWTYGRIEIKAKLPQGRGTWPALFMMPSENIKSVFGWPSSGEIDIMEHVGYNPGTVQTSVHCHEYNHPQGTHKFGTLYIDDPFNEYHIYAVEWYPDRLDFFVDENRFFTFENELSGWKAWPFYKDFYLILNLAIGGSWGGAQGIDDSIFPTQMVIDYVRVYQTDLEKLGYNMLDYAPEE
ncbi:MAG: glycoside hydrolase family 16 protein [Spirochaetales bacterium]|nr:glycoside hydrolase family 16 protein [Spirochaetales bacterium]